MDTTVSEVSARATLSVSGRNEMRQCGRWHAGPMVSRREGRHRPEQRGAAGQDSREVTYKTSNYIFVDDGSKVKNLYGLFTESGRDGPCRAPRTWPNDDTVGVTGIVEGSIPNNPDWTVTAPTYTCETGTI